MKPQQKYLSAQSMRVALEDRLNRMAKDKSADIMRLRRHVAFDRVDVAAGDTWLEPHEKVKTQDWFGFAGIEAPMIPVISQEQQFAEKVHAYTLPRKTPNSRVKDLVDILLLIENGTLKTERIKNALSKTFQRRKTHPIPLDLPQPPESWKTPFKKMAETCGIQDDIGLAFDKIRQFFKTIAGH